MNQKPHQHVSCVHSANGMHAIDLAKGTPVAHPFYVFMYVTNADDHPYRL